MASSTVYDALELKAMIKSLKLKKVNITSEIAAAKKQLDESLVVYQKTKTELNSLSIEDEMKYSEHCEEGVLDKRFEAMDWKLNLQILNDELKINLPKLEKEAILWEGKMRQAELLAKDSANAVRDIPLHYTQTSEELEALINSLTEKKLKLQDSIKSDVVAKTNQLKEYKHEISSLRSQITGLIEQKSLVQQSANRLQAAVLSEETRLSTLRREYDELSSLFENLNRK